jgi:hypothetical protein
MFLNAFRGRASSAASWWRRAQGGPGRFSGDVANFKIFVFCLASAMAAVGGAMFTLQVGFMSPSFVGIVPRSRW